MASPCFKSGQQQLQVVGVRTQTEDDLQPSSSGMPLPPALTNFLRLSDSVIGHSRHIGLEHTRKGHLHLSRLTDDIAYSWGAQDLILAMEPPMSHIWVLMQMASIR